MTRFSKKLSKRLSKNQDGLGSNKKREAVAADINKLIEAHNALAKITQNKIDELTSRLDDTSIVLQGISQVVGVNKVAEASKRVRIDILEAEAAEQSQNVVKAYESGNLTKTFEVTEKSLLVITIKKADGTVLYPTKSHMVYGNIKPEVRILVFGKKIGDVVSLPDGSSLEILELYEECVPATSGFLSEVGAPSVDQTIELPTQNVAE